jgi:hypothetical protein
LYRKIARELPKRIVDGVKNVGHLKTVLIREKDFWRKWFEVNQQRK